MLLRQNWSVVVVVVY